jgi:hypothetical protein
MLTRQTGERRTSQKMSRGREEEVMTLEPAKAMMRAKRKRERKDIVVSSLKVGVKVCSSVVVLLEIFTRRDIREVKLKKEKERKRTVEEVYMIPSWQQRQ